MYTKDISIWLYIYLYTDPMWHKKYPHLSLYAYCADNPMRFIAPDGLMIGTNIRTKMAILKLCGVNRKIKYTKTITEILEII